MTSIVYNCKLTVGFFLVSRTPALHSGNKAGISENELQEHRVTRFLSGKS